MIRCDAARRLLRLGPNADIHLAPRAKEPNQLHVSATNSRQPYDKDATNRAAFQIVRYVQ